MERFLRIIRDPKNRQALGWLGGGVLVLGSALWVVITHFFPAGTAPQAVIEPPVRVEATGGSIASGRDTNIQGGVRPGWSAPEAGAEGAPE